MRYLTLTYMRKPGGQIDEVAAVTKTIKQSDIQTCNVILDYAYKKVVKCYVEGQTMDNNWDSLDQYYKKVYPAIIERLEREALLEK